MGYDCAIQGVIVGWVGSVCAGVAVTFCCQRVKRLAVSGRMRWERPHLMVRPKSLGSL